MIGTSFTIGMRVPREKTFAALLPLELSRRTGLKVELYNEAMPFKLPDTIASHFNEVLKAKPDMVLWALNLADLQSQRDMGLRVSTSHFKFWERVLLRLRAFSATSLSASISDLFRHTRTATMLFQVLYRSQSGYVKSVLMDTDKAKYLRSEQGAECHNRLNEFNNSVARIATQARDADVPLVVVLLPNHVQSAMVSMGEWPAGFDPYNLDNELRAIISSQGGTYIDMLTDIRSIPNPDLGYFPVEGHPNARGHAIFSKLLAKELTNGAVSALANARKPKSVVGQER